MTLKRLVLSLLLLGSVAPDVDRSRATAQEPDIIGLEGKDYPLLVNPLESYLTQKPAQ